MHSEWESYLFPLPSLLYSFPSQRDFLHVPSSLINKIVLKDYISIFTLKIKIQSEIHCKKTVTVKFMLH